MKVYYMPDDENFSRWREQYFIIYIIITLVKSIVLRSNYRRSIKERPEIVGLCNAICDYEYSVYFMYN